MKRFLFAAMLGAAAGVLFAPRKGEETRQKLKGTLRDNGVDIDELKTSEGREKAAEALKQRAQELKEKGEGLVDRVTNHAHAEGDAGSQELEVRVLDAAPDTPPTNGAANAHQTRKLDDESTPNGSA